MPACRNMPRAGSAPIGVGGGDRLSPTATCSRWCRCPPTIPTASPTGSAISNGRCCRQDDHLPLMNKVLQGLYPPGSTVKPMNALALLDAGRRSGRDGSIAPARFAVGNGIFHCHSSTAMARSTCTSAIAQSCDIYFYEMVRRLGIDTLAPISAHIGLGREVRPALPHPALRHRARSGVECSGASTATGRVDTVNAVDRPGLCAGQSAPARGDGGADRAAAAMLQPRLLAEPARQHGRRRCRCRPEHLAVRPRRDVTRWSTTAAPAARRGCRSPGVADRRQDRHRAGPPHHHGGARRRRASTTDACPSRCATTRCSSASRRPTTRAMRSASSLEHGGHGAQPRAPIGRDIMTYLFDRDRRWPSLAEVEPTWGGDIATRMAARAAYRAARRACRAAATETDAPTPATRPRSSARREPRIDAAALAIPRAELAARHCRWRMSWLLRHRRALPWQIILLVLGSARSDGRAVFGRGRCCSPGRCRRDRVLRPARAGRCRGCARRAA